MYEAIQVNMARLKIEDSCTAVAEHRQFLARKAVAG
jgi:hypothetical protein